MNTLEKTLIDLSRYGNPRVSRLDSGWHASIDMHVNATGAKFEVRSEFGHKTPIDAANECADRVKAIMSGFKNEIGRLEVVK